MIENWARGERERERRQTWSWCRRCSSENPEFRHALGSAGEREEGEGQRKGDENERRKKGGSQDNQQRQNTTREVQSEHKRAVQTAGIRHAVRIKKHLKVSILLVQGAGWILVEGHDHLRTLKRSAR